MKVRYTDRGFFLGANTQYTLDWDSFWLQTRTARLISEKLATTFCRYVIIEDWARVEGLSDAAVKSNCESGR